MVQCKYSFNLNILQVASSSQRSVLCCVWCLFNVQRVAFQLNRADPGVLGAFHRSWPDDLCEFGDQQEPQILVRNCDALC